LKNLWCALASPTTWGLKFYDRKEIKDALAYLRVIVNPADSKFIAGINTPRRGIGQASVDAIAAVAQELGVTYWEILQDETSVNTLAGRAAKSITKFVQMICHRSSSTTKRHLRLSKA